jgi:ribose transport system permease protein
MPEECARLDGLNMPDDTSSPHLTKNPDRTRGIISAARRLKLAAMVGQYGLLIAWAVVALFFTLLPQTSQTFPTTNNFATIFGSQAVIVMLTLALLIPLTAGDYDLSVGFTLTLSAMLVALLNVQHHWPIALAVLAAVASGALIGIVNGAFILIFRIESLIVTLGTGTFVGGVVLFISGSNTISGVSPGLVDLVIVKRFLGIPLDFYYGLLLCLIIWYVFEFTPLGRRLLFVGRGRNVARLSGIHVDRVRLGALMASGVISAIGGVVYAGTTGAADPTSGTQLLLPAFAAVFLGATTIVPGRFNPVGSLVAVYFLVTGITGFQLLGAQSYVQSLFYGGALVIAVALSQLARKRQALDTGN